ncbi:MAG TPA: FAD-dependent oxidoreductase [Solirubrobacteraceae bacterium]|jgi:glycine/D-amino acid oxidase-like deaminating enzyme
MSGETKADIVVIGAGIHGASVVHSLSRRLPDAQIVVIDLGDAGMGATAASAAMLMHQTDDEDLTRLAQLSIERYASWADSGDLKIHFNLTGSILFSTTATASKRLQDHIRYQQALGIPTTEIDGDTVEALTKGLISRSGILAASYCESDGYVVAREVVDGFLGYAIDRGATFRPRAAASNIVVEDGQVAGVVLENGDTLTTNCVVNCAGAKAREIGQWAGIELPIKRSHRNMLLLKAARAPLDAFPIVEDLDSGWYFRQHPEGVLMGVGPTNWLDDDDAKLDATYNPQYEEAAIEYLSERAPSLLPFSAIRTWAGSRPMLDPVMLKVREGTDGHPIVGGVADVGGLYLSCAWGAFGVTLAPIGGELAAQAICGEKPTVDMAPFSWARFASDRTTRGTDE